jgi:hypothetical protein
VTMEKTLRRHNVEDVLAAIEFVEQHAPKAAPVHFPAGLVNELKSALPTLAPSGTDETITRMGELLDKMQFAISDEQGAAPQARASHAFEEHRERSERKRAASARMAAVRRR